MRSLLLTLSFLGLAPVAAAQVPFSDCVTIVQGVSCILISPDSGGLYIPQNAPQPLVVGERWFITGTTDGCISFCLQGNGCLDIATMTGCSPATSFCSGDGLLTDHTTPCPCGNNGITGNGCAHSFSASGSNLAATGNTNPDTVQLQSSNTPVTSFTLFMQHDALGDALFHDGVLCASGTLIRLRGRGAVGGACAFPDSNFPNDATLTLSQRGQVTPGSGAVRYYAAFYRNASTTFCPPATANVSNGLTLVW